MSKIFGKKEAVITEPVKTVNQTEDEIVLDRDAFGICKNKDNTYSVIRIKFNNDGHVGALEKLVTDSSFLLISSQFKIEVANSGLLENNA